MQIFDSELEAFETYAKALPEGVSLLVDTFDTLDSGVPNAIKTAKMLESQGKRMASIRLDSGDLAYLSIQARSMLDAAGLDYVKIVASNDLDENTIFNLKAQGARIDIWGVGTQLITAADQPALGGVYKMVEREREGKMEPTIKISGNPEKVTSPGRKDVLRIVSKENGKAIADYICFPQEEQARNGGKLRLFDPVHPYIKKSVKDYEAVSMQQPIFLEGELVYRLPDLEQIKAYHQEQLNLFWPEYLRKLNPEFYRVSLSQEAWELKQKMIEEHLGQHDE
ncbi:Nicotinate phosphoribosyltransferase pncB2 [compost metagenome]